MSKVCFEASNVFLREIQRETSMYLESVEHQGVDTDALSIGRAPRELGREALERECLAVSQKTSGNLSSMLVDIRNGRRTEIDFLNGHLIKMGHAHGVDTPVTTMLRSLIKMRENIPVDSLVN
jgi:2-dehydropantoate 2-reductase